MFNDSRRALLALTAGAALICFSTPLFALDLTGDGNGDFLVWNGGVLRTVSANGATSSIACGTIGDIPLAGRLGSAGSPLAAVWRNGSGQSGETQSAFYLCEAAGTIKFPLGEAGDEPFASQDFDGDGIDDLATWRPRTGEWQIQQSAAGFTSFLFGLPEDTPAPCDYTGDGIANAAVYRHSTGQWFIRESSQHITVLSWGLTGDIPVPADYDGDGRCDLAVYRPVNSTFYVIPSGTAGGAVVRVLEGSGRPIAADIDNDGRADFAIFRADASIAYTLSAAEDTGASLATGITAGQIVNSPLRQRAVRNDFDGDGTSDLGVVRELVPGLLHWLIAEPHGTATAIQQWGLRGDRLMARDYDGDLRTDLAVIRSLGGFLHWFIKPSSESPVRSEILGTSLDAPLAGDFDADGFADLAVVRLAAAGTIEWYVKSSLSHQTISQSWGLIGDYVTTGEFIRRGRSSAVVIRPQLGGLTWYARDFGGGVVPAVSWGLAGDRPVPADYDGDGRTDYAVVRNSNGLLFLYVRTASGQILAPRTWGLTGDTVVTGNYSGTGQAEPAVWRSDTQAFYAVASTNGTTTLVPWGLKGDRVIPTIDSYASSAASTTPQSTDEDASEFHCTKTLSPSDGSGGFVHKPVSDSDGKLAVVLPSKYAGQTTRLSLGSQGKILEQGRFAGNNNGNRPHFRFKKPGGSYPSYLVEIAYLNNGEQHCYTIPSPGKRYD